MIWRGLHLRISRFFCKPAEKVWLKNLIDNFEQKVAEGRNIPFRINQIKEKGFVIKINGLCGFISFNHMPWRYKDRESWKYVFKHLQERTFFCKIHKFEKEPLSITVNGDIPQFKKLILTKDTEYEGVIIKKSKYGLFVDFGYHFNWQYSSFVQLIHKSKIDKPEFEALNCGDTFKVFYRGETETNLAVFKGENSDYYEELIGKIVNVEIKKNLSNQTAYLIEGLHKGFMPVTRKHYPNRIKQIRLALRGLSDGETIHCEVVRITKNKKLLELKWIIESEIDKALNRKLAEAISKSAAYNVKPIIDNDLSDKIKMIGDIVDVEVIKNEDRFGRSKTEYLVNNEFQGDLIIANENYQLSNKVKSLVEKSFKGTEMLKCTVVSIEKYKVRVKWEIPDSILFKFIVND